jgi:hypothetical protein
MKKNLFIAGSFILAIALFAFTTATAGKTKSPDPEFYWYTVTYDGSTPMIEYQSPDHLTVAEAEPLFDCGSTERVCKAGFASPLTFNGTEPILEVTEGIENFYEVDPLK